MVYWRSRGPAVVGDFDPERCRQLYLHVDRFRGMLADAEMWQRARTSGHGDLFVDRHVVMAHRRAMAVVGLSPAEGDPLRRMLRDADTVLGTLRNSARELVLTKPAQIGAWIWTLYECAMDIALYAGIPWGPDRPADPFGLPWELHADHRAVSWLLEVVDALVDVTGTSVWTPFDDL